MYSIQMRRGSVIRGGVIIFISQIARWKVKENKKKRTAKKKENHDDESFFSDGGDCELECFEFGDDLAIPSDIIFTLAGGDNDRAESTCILSSI